MGISKTNLFSKNVSLNKKSLITDVRLQKMLIRHNHLTEDNLNTLIELYNIANSVYPNQCDLQVNLLGYSNNKILLNYAILIHFPDLVVNNSHNVNHPIKDMFFRIKLTANGRIDGFDGNRTTFSLIEYYSNYKFSHLSRIGLDEVPDYRHFCFGDGDLPKLQSRFNCSASDKKFEVFKILCFCIEGYLSWESLEGVPYIRLSEVINKSNEWNPNSPNRTNCLYYAFNIIRSYRHEIDCDFIYQDGKYVIDDNEIFEKSLALIAQNHYSSQGFLYSKGSDGKLYSTKKAKNKIKLSTLPVIFQGQEFYYSIYNRDEDPIIYSEQFYINPQIKYYVRAILNSQANSTISTNGILKRFQDRLRLGQEY